MPAPALEHLGIDQILWTAIQIGHNAVHGRGNEGFISFIRHTAKVRVDDLTAHVRREFPPTISPVIHRSRAAWGPIYHEARHQEDSSP